MRHYYRPLYREVVGPVETESSLGVASEVRRERVPALIDALDCLLALWVAEATLDAGPDTRSTAHPALMAPRP